MKTIPDRYRSQIGEEKRRVGRLSKQVKLKLEEEAVTADQEAQRVST